MHPFSRESVTQFRVRVASFTHSGQCFVCVNHVTYLKSYITLSQEDAYNFVPCKGKTEMK